MSPGGGPVGVALALAREGLRVGLATALPDDTVGRRWLDRLTVSGVDVAAVVLARPGAGVVRVDATSGTIQLPALRSEQAVEVPARWSAKVVLLSGLSPVVSQAAALCKAARGARRDGAFVLLDFNASLHAWAGSDPRTIRMVLREVDAARCSVADLAVVGLGAEHVRAELRADATFVVTDADGRSVATGPFGEVVFAPSEPTLRRAGSGDALTAAICAELARRVDVRESLAARWSRALQRGARMRRIIPG
jgi:sugar/nucleoside kinase (ribokinase family)